MQKVDEPGIFVVAQTHSEPEAIRMFLEVVGAPNWKSDAGSGVELIPELMGRLCYRSFDPGLNPNVTRVREGNEKYLGHVLEVMHGSLLEHVSISFIFRNVSRVFTHELVRHRAGVAISQESLRFVRLNDLPIWIPNWARQDQELMNRANSLLAEMESFQYWMANHFGLDDKGVPFEEKKHKTSFMRRFAPIGVATSIGWTANIRALRHVIEMRTDPAAEEEIRLVFGKVAELCRERFPNLFSDYEVEEVKGLPWYRPIHRKV